MVSFLPWTQFFPIDHSPTFAALRRRELSPSHPVAYRVLQFRLESTPLGASPLSPATSPNIAVAGGEGGGTERAHSLTLLQPGDLGTNEAAHTQPRASQSSGPGRAASLPPPPTPKQGPIERMYRHFW